ncbi:MAG: hypothetical protein MH321_06090 [Leptospiraceae bacterium]|nr:hypothetical protein [Leptospiraceae bacterium]
MAIIRDKNERFNLVDLKEERESLTNDIKRIKNEINQNIEEFKNSFYLEIKKRLVETALDSNFKVEDNGDEWNLNYYDQIQFKGDYFHDTKIIEKLIGDDKITFRIFIEGAIEFPKGRLSELDVALNPVDDQLRVLKMYGNHRLTLITMLKNLPKENFIIKFTIQHNREKVHESIIPMIDQEKALKKIIKALTNRVK